METETNRINIDTANLDLIEGYLKCNDNKTVSGMRSLLHKIIYSYNDVCMFTKVIRELISKKTVYYIRHAHAIHNDYLNKKRAEESGDYSALRDPCLSDEGVEECKAIKCSMTELWKDSDISHPAPEVVFLSPFRRTIQTLQNIKEAFCPDIKFLVSDLIREKFCEVNTHTGHKLEVLKKLYQEEICLNWEYITKEIWWDYSISDEKYCEIEKLTFSKEVHDDFLSRIFLFFLWITYRKEKNIVILSHSKVYKLILGRNKAKIANAEYKILDQQVIISFLESNLKFILKKKANYRKK